VHAGELRPPRGSSFSSARGRAIDPTLRREERLSPDLHPS
jgi:hypothetical protein